MDKKLILKYLVEATLSEAKTPGIDTAKAIKTKEDKINKAANKSSEKNLSTYQKDTEKTMKSDTKMAPNKFNATGKDKKYHDEMEILNGQEMIQYDREPSEEFSKKAKQAIEGDSKMGNAIGANAEETWGASSDNFGKDLVKRIKSSKKERDANTPKFHQFGNDIEVNKDKSFKGKKLALSEGILADNNYTHFAINKSTNKILEAWNYSNTDNESIRYYCKEDLKSLDLPLKPSQIKVITEKAVMALGLNPQDINDWDDLKKPQQTDKPQPSINENSKTNTNTMKRLKFKKLFNGVGNALKLIPESYREDNKEFEMTDSNETYRIRWEGSLNEGSAVVLAAANKTMINEDIQRMKSLFNYKSENTLGLLKGNSRINENNTFNDIYSKTKKLLTESDEDEDILESENIEGQKPSKTAPWEEAGQTVAPEVPAVHKKKLQTKDGTAPAAPTKDADDAVSVAPEVPAVHKKKLQTKDGTAPSVPEGPWEEISEGENIEGQKPSKTAPWEKAGQTVAPEVPAVHKKKLQEKDGTAPAAPTKDADDAVGVAPEVPAVHKKKLQTKDGTAPAPKTDNLDDAGITQAADAKKHIHMHESMDDMDDSDADADAPEDNYYSAGDDTSGDEEEAPSVDAEPVPSMGGDDEEGEDDIDAMLTAPATPAPMGAKLLHSASTNSYAVASGGKTFLVPNNLLDLAKSDPMAAFSKIKSLRGL